MGYKINLPDLGEEADVRFAISCCEWILKRQPADADAKKLLESCQERLARMKRIRPEPPLKHLHD